MKTVGVFDSGVGGLSVLRALLAELPGVRFVYVADSAYAPYGERTVSEITDRSERITAWLRHTHRIDALVVACNTATALAIDSLRATHPDLPIVGVEPALKPAAAMSHTRHIGVLATRGTLNSERFARLRTQLESTASSPVHFICQPCDGLADAIERDDVQAQQTLCERYVTALREHAPGDMDTVVLGCTHYPFAADVLAQLLGPDVTLVDTGIAVARRTRAVLGLSIEVGSGATPPRLLSTGDPAALSLAASRWLGIQTQAEKLVA
ncbi:glutamate racemase [Hydrogenophaga sp.]|uniref:glutamate racemase n=1 Tax=Hydrogenophaga sp. TaxID=1904254 RepID=UPI002731B499|nr:glutamate racemase [Hydrogenophaga sp.]MDP2015167.1 glutamate racemase [Hydrogenophaga sp.]MDP3164458.1 glutamate racemase [Hydrogenophaga sp.]MDP3809890.1 glutamate racemase [Hydrogenophaga sp.]